MSYKTKSSGRQNRYLYNETGLVSNNTAANTSHRAGDDLFYEIEPAEVLDIILDDTHELNSGSLYLPENIGKILYKPLYSGNSSISSPLMARPLNANIRQYPIKGEILAVSSDVWDIDKDTVPNGYVKGTRFQIQKVLEDGKTLHIAPVGNPLCVHNVKSSEIGKNLDRLCYGDGQTEYDYKDDPDTDLENLLIVGDK